VTATTRFYTGFFVALAIVVALSFFVGYRFGAASHDRAVVTHHKAPAR